MNKQPFWVVTARCDDGNNGWRSWIVCVQTTPEDAARIKATLEEQRDRYLTMREPLTTEFTRRMQELRDGVMVWASDDLAAFWKDGIGLIVSEIDMLDRRFQWVRWMGSDLPEYQIEESSDDPHTTPDLDAWPEWP